MSLSDNRKVFFNNKNRYKEGSMRKEYWYPEKKLKEAVKLLKENYLSNN